MKEDYAKKILQVSIHKKDDSPFFGESSILVSVDDEGGGKYIRLQSSLEGLEQGEIALNPEELQIIAETAEELLKQFEDS